MPVDPQLYVAFVLAAAVLALFPGPVATLVIANSLKHGTGTGMRTVAGANVGTAALAVAGALGLTTLIAVAAEIFEWVRWVGVAYLVYLGLREWRQVFRTDTVATARDADARPKGVLLHGFIIAVTNPKTLFFLVSLYRSAFNARIGERFLSR